MKIAILGAGGVRTPLIVQAIVKRQDRLGIDELSLMDIDAERLEIIYALTAADGHLGGAKFHINRTSDARDALSTADFVITTFRVGGIESRVIDERVPLELGVLGQETTGAGGFAMGIRSIPVMLGYVRLMEKLCPEAWLINFANPAGMLSEAVVRNTTWRRIVGICDTPASMQRAIAALLGASAQEISSDYFGLNHLGWVKKIIHEQQDKLPQVIQSLKAGSSLAGLPFSAEMVASLGMIPNEYLYYYYCTSLAVSNILAASESRGEHVARQNGKLFAGLKEKLGKSDLAGMSRTYQAYLDERGGTYMQTETGWAHPAPSTIVENLEDEGYAGVALDVIEALLGNQPRRLILNIPNAGAIHGMDDLDVVEIPAMVSRDRIQPMALGGIPAHCMQLMQQVKQFEHLTIEAAVEGSYSKALQALTTHPLVKDEALARSILDEYLARHQGYFPALH